MSRYNHWFWNSRFVDGIVGVVVYLNNYLWSKQYGKN